MIYTKVFFNLSKTGNFLYKVTYMNYKYENTSVTSILSTALPAGANYQFSIVRWWGREGGGGGKKEKGKKGKGYLAPPLDITSFYFFILAVLSLQHLQFSIQCISIFQTSKI